MDDKISSEPQGIGGVSLDGEIEEVGHLFEEESSSTSLQRPLQENDNNLTMSTYPLFPVPSPANHSSSQFPSSFQHMTIPDATSLTSVSNIKYGSSMPISKSTPDFVRKLYNILEDEKNKETICWSRDLDSIIILNPTLFSSVVLPLHFKHCKFASFVRQLNKHNFHRVKLPPDNEYGEHACEYKHPMFQKGRHDLLERIFRQQSKISGSSTASSLFHVEASQDTNEQKTTISVDRLSQGQKSSFYQIKELERRVDFFERELANCFYVVELQARLIRDLLFILPNEVRNNPEILSLTNDLKWNSSGINLGKFDQISNIQTVNNIGFHTSNLQAQQQHLTQKQHSINQQQQQLNEQKQQFNIHINSHNKSFRQHQPSKDSDWWAKSIGQQKTPAALTNPFHNNDHNQMMGSSWNGSDMYTNESVSSLSYIPQVSNSPRFRIPDTIQSLNILTFVGSTREQRLISDVLLELSCLSFKFAVDISHVFSCLDDKSEAYHVVILDQVHESYSLINRLRQFNNQLIVVFANEVQQDPTPPPSEKIDRTLSLTRPVTLLGMRHCLTKCLEYFQS